MRGMHGAWALGAGGIGVSLLLAACTLDFGQFDPSDASVPDAASDGGADAVARVDAGSGVDASCTPKVQCLTTATSCAATCAATSVSCQNAGGCNQTCKVQCRQAEAQCRAQCATTCASCEVAAGCPATQACADAAATD